MRQFEIEAKQLVERVRRAADASDLDPYGIAHRVVGDLPPAFLRALAAQYVTDRVIENRRVSAVRVEKKAVYKSIARNTDYAERVQAESAERQRQSSDRLGAAMQSAIDEFKSACHVEWTEELLNTHIAMNDGTRVLWGDATVAQHEERFAMFSDNALRNAEGAARHGQAIDELRATGAKTLREAVAA